MKTPHDSLSERFAAALTQAFGEDYAEVDPLIAPAQNPKFGDYQANVAMSLAKRLGQKPRDIAQQIVDALEVSDLCDQPPAIAGPGFINLTCSADYLARLAADAVDDQRLGIAPVDDPMKIVVDYSGPNVAKEMHVGHLRSTVIGDAIARTLDFLGHDVVRQNHLGDWGTQFGMLIEYLVEQGAEQLDTLNIPDLNRMYQQAKQRFDADADFADRARQRVVLLQGGDQHTLHVWQLLVAESKKHFNAVYGRLNVTLADNDIRPESSYNDALPGVVQSLEKAGMTSLSDGAVCVFMDQFKGSDDEPLPMIIRKSDGGYLYATTDLAALRYRIGELEARRIIYVTDARQKQHFAMVFAAVKQAGWAGDEVSLEHVPFGTILGPDNKPFKTRSGDTVKLVDLLDEAEQRAAAIVAEKNPELSEGDRTQVARVVGIGAVKYADLSGDRVKDYVFAWDRMLAMDGNTAPYLQYAYARIQSIFRKAEIDAATLPAAVQVEHEAERALVLKLVQLGPVVASVAQTLEPHRLCTYLYELAAVFSSFYEKCPVLRADNDAQKQSRLVLCKLTANTLKQGLDLLGIDVLERM